MPLYARGPLLSYGKVRIIIKRQKVTILITTIERVKLFTTLFSAI